MAGRALQRVLLTATGVGVRCAFLNEPVEDPELRPRLASLFESLVPQVVLRFGFGPAATPEPRRLIEEALLPA